MKPIISVENLGKRYSIQQEIKDAPTNIREAIAALPRKLLGRGKKPSVENFWALKDVSFDVMPGDRVGIIGRNGAGKSTLLKLLSRITEPTIGKITMRGRVASLLEVGTGFHPELTGRENIFLNGAILGMGRAEVKRKFDEIVDFSGVEQFLDTPVKRYSSGMYVRLGFAVAAHLEPEILIVDEVLAVGDMEFQKKCLGKMEEVSSGQGRTVLFVSHQMSMIEKLCPRAMLLQNGALLCLEASDRAIPKYLRGALGRSIGNYKSISKNNFIHQVQILDENHNLCTDFKYGDQMSVMIEVYPKDILYSVEIRIKSSMGELIAYASSFIQQPTLFSAKETQKVFAHFKALHFVAGEYIVDIICRLPKIAHYENLWDTLSFRISSCQPENSPIPLTAPDSLGFYVMQDVQFEVCRNA